VLGLQHCYSYTSHSAHYLSRSMSTTNGTDKAQHRLRILVVGGSIAGLGCAYTLAKAGHEVVVFEQSDGVWRVSRVGSYNMAGVVLNILLRVLPVYLGFLRMRPCYLVVGDLRSKISPSKGGIWKGSFSGMVRNIFLLVPSSPTLNPFSQHRLVN
jgi:hypothetical protein